MLIKLFQGFCMALADSVPGVSGGTVAFILGFYERFIGALHGLFGKDPTARGPALAYLVKLGAGWCCGMAASMLALAQLFERNIYFLSSLFLGLTMASIPFVIAEEKHVILKNKRSWPFLLAGLLLVCGLTVFRASSINGGAVDYLNLRPVQAVYLFVSGALAITAMVLPGVSGSTLLLIMGVYMPTVGAIHAFLHLDMAALPGLAALGFGILFGVAVSIHALRAALRKYRGQMIYLILGLMLGSLAPIAMGPATLPAPKAALSAATFQPVGFLLGIAILLALEQMKKLTAQREITEQAAFMKNDLHTDEA